MDRQFLCIAGLVAARLGRLLEQDTEDQADVGGTRPMAATPRHAPHLVERPPTTDDRSSTRRGQLPSPNHGPGLRPALAVGFPPSPTFQPASRQARIRRSDYPTFRAGSGHHAGSVPDGRLQPAQALRRTRSRPLPRSSRSSVPALPPIRCSRIGSAHGVQSARVRSRLPAWPCVPRDRGAVPAAAAAADPSPAAAPIAAFPPRLRPRQSQQPGRLRTRLCSPRGSVRAFEPDAADGSTVEAAHRRHSAAGRSMAPQPGSRTHQRHGQGGRRRRIGRSVNPAQPSTLPYDVVQVFYGTDREATEPPDERSAGPDRAVPARRWPAPRHALPGDDRPGQAPHQPVGAGRPGADRQRGTGPPGDGRHARRSFAARSTRGRATPATARRTRACRSASAKWRSPKTHKPGELEVPVDPPRRSQGRRGQARRPRQDRAPGRTSSSTNCCGSGSPPRRAKRSSFSSTASTCTFEDAARRTAQIHKDLKFEGAPVFFSWPAHDKFILTYMADANNIPWTTPHLKQFLLEVVHESGAKSINLIAHSMGNRALTATLRELELEIQAATRGSSTR